MNVPCATAVAEETVGLLLESILLKLYAGTFEWVGILLFPVDLPVHMLN